MTLDNLQVGQILTVRVYKRYGTQYWANNYEVQAVNINTSPESELLVLAQTLAAWEATFHDSSVRIDRVVISTVQPDSTPYNPLAFISINLQQQCLRQPVGSTTVLPLEACLFVRKVAPYGRNGKLLYRGVLYEEDLAALGFEPSLVNSSVTALQTAISAILNNNVFTSSWRFVLFDLRNLVIRPVNFLVVNPTITFKKRTNAYFDRRDTGSGGD